jgi:hypothetical protein
VTNNGNRNKWGEIVVVGASGPDQDADGNWNVRVLNSDFTTSRKLLIGGQLNAVISSSVTEGDINTQPVDTRTVRQLVGFGTDTAGKGECWYEDSAGSMVEITDSNDDIDTTVLLTASEAYSKLFIANDTNLKVADFTNTKLTVTALTTAPDRGSVVTQVTSGAQMVVDFVNTAKTLIYGRTITGTFTTTAGHTLSGGSMDPTTRVPSAVTSPPHWYTWTEYPKGNTTGLPDRSTLVCTYRGRLVLSGNSDYPHQWYMSRQANPFDFFYLVNDAQAPVAGSNADAGEIGDVITCLAPNKDDYLVIGCVNSIWVMRGDPAAGGSLDEISLATGVFGAFSYCWDAMDNFYFFGSHGISRIPASLRGVENLSVTTLPNLVNELAISPTTHRITMAYDREREGIIICITTIATGAHTAYWYDLRTSGFFPEDYGLNPSPFSLFFYESATAANRRLLLGGADGYIRYFDDDSKDDDIGPSDVAIDSYATIGPVAIGRDVDSLGRMKTMAITTGTDTDSVTYDIHVADSAEEVVDDVTSGATPLHTGTISAGNRVQMLRPRSRGAWMGIKLQNDTATETWQFEKLVADVDIK